MGQVRITATHREEIDIEKLAMALLALAGELEDEPEEDVVEPREEDTPPKPPAQEPAA